MPSNSIKKLKTTEHLIQPYSGPQVWNCPPSPTFPQAPGDSGASAGTVGQGTLQYSGTWEVTVAENLTGPAQPEQAGIVVPKQDLRRT